MGLIDHETLHRVMADYAAALVEPSADLLGLLHRLSDDCVAVLQLAGAAMSLNVRPELLDFATATDDDVVRAERAQDDLGEGPGPEAHRSGRLVPVHDTRADQRWPTWAQACASLGYRAVLGVPMPVDGGDSQLIGAVSLYDTRPRDWTSDERDVAALLSNTATGFVTAYRSLSAETHRTHQLRHALDSRVVVEQAKGMLAAHRGCDVDTAFELMRRYARTARRRVHDVADEIVRGTIPAALADSDEERASRDGRDAVRSRTWGRPGNARPEDRQGRP